MDIWQYKDDAFNIRTYFRYRPVIQFDLNGNLIAEFSSIKQANERTGISNILICCNGTQRTADGFIQKYKNSQMFLGIPKIINKLKISEIKQNIG